MLARSCLIAVALVSAAPAAVMAQGQAPKEQGQLQVQINAAQISARAASRNIFEMSEIHRRLQSAINCLVGPKDPDFKADAPNPCATTGNGVIPDHPDAGRKARYREAVMKLKTVMAMEDRKQAMEAALETADMIAAISEGN